MAITNGYTVNINECVVFSKKKCNFSSSSLVVPVFVLFFSTIWRLDTFFGFYANVLMEVMVARLHINYLIASASFHLGICMYIGEMIQQMKRQMREINGAMIQRPNFADINRKLIAEIQIHDDILV